MAYGIFIIGLIMGFILNIIVNIISTNILIDKSKEKRNLLKGLKEGIFLKIRFLNILIIFSTGLLFIISYFRIGFNIMFFKAVVFDCILIIVAFVDLKNNIISNNIVMITLITGALFFFTGDISFISAILGMLVGGGILFLLALIPGALGGGDIKFMFALGTFLGLSRTLKAILSAFVLAAFISILLLLFKIKGRKDHIPFGPFLALGSFIAFHFFI